MDNKDLTKTVIGTVALGLLAGVAYLGYKVYQEVTNDSLEDIWEDFSDNFIFKWPDQEQ